MAFYFRIGMYTKFKLNRNTIFISKLEGIKIFISFFIILSFYTFGNFGFWNLFGVKYEIQLFILVFISIPLIIVTLYKLKLSLYKEPLILIIIYSIFSSLVLYPSNLLNIAQLLVSLLFVISLFRLKMVYIDFILKGIITLCTFFSILGIIQLIIFSGIELSSSP